MGEENLYRRDDRKPYNFRDKTSDTVVLAAGFDDAQKDLRQKICQPRDCPVSSETNAGGKVAFVSN